MPQIFMPAVMTNGGAVLLNKAISGECEIQITRMASGSGTYTTAEKEILSLQKRSSLKHEEQSTALSSLTIETETSVLATAVFTNDSLEAAYHINEIGLFAQEKGKSGTEVLYSIAVVSEEQGEIMPISNGKNPVRIIQSWAVTVSNSAQVTLNLLSDDAFALASDVGQLNQLVTGDKSSIVSAINWLTNKTFPAVLEAMQIIRLYGDKVESLDGIVIEATLTNTSKYPFNNSVKTLALGDGNMRDNKDYTIAVETEAVGGFVGDIVITDKMLNGFKIAYTGSASSVKVKCYVRGGK